MSFITTPNELPAPGTTGNVLTSNGTIWTSQAAAAAGFTLGTPVSCSGQASITFTGIPSTAKIVNIIFNGFQGSYNASINSILITLGTSGGLSTSGYSSKSVLFDDNLGTPGPYTNTNKINSYMTQNGSTTSAIEILTTEYVSDVQGIFQLALENSSTNKWSGFGTLTSQGRNWGATGAGYQTLSGTLSQIQIKTQASTLGYSGQINIAYM